MILAGSWPRDADAFNLGESSRFFRSCLAAPCLCSFREHFGGHELARKQQLHSSLSGTVSEVYAALGRTLAFRRWQPAIEPDSDPTPPTGCRYCCRTGSVLRSGRVVETVRPVGLTLHEVLQDSPCRVALTLRWRIEPVPAGCIVRLCASYRLNRAAALRTRHWDRRLARHFRNQFRFLARNLEGLRAHALSIRASSQNVI
jgi:hypothetical protein